MSNCIMCNNIVPEGRQVCSLYEGVILKIGVLLQARNANQEDVYNAYNQYQKKEGTYE